MPIETGRWIFASPEATWFWHISVAYGMIVTGLLEKVAVRLKKNGSGYGLLSMGSLLVSELSPLHIP